MSQFAFWEEFYDTRFTTYNIALNGRTNRFTKINDNFFDTLIYKKRLKVTIEPFLLHANTLAKQSHKKAYCRDMTSPTEITYKIWITEPSYKFMLIDQNRFKNF